MTPNPNEDRDSGDKGKEPISPSNVTEVVQFSRSTLFTDLKFLSRDDNQRGVPPVSDEKLVEPDYAPAPALTTLGDKHEEHVVEQLAPMAGVVRVWEVAENAPDLSGHPDAVCDPDFSDDEIIETIERVARGSTHGPALLVNPDLNGWIDDFPINSEADIVVVWPAKPDDDTDAAVHIRAMDVKAGEEKPHHQLQAVFYSTIINKILDEGTDVEYDLTAGIIDGDTSINFLDYEELPSFNPASRREDIRRLLAEDGFLNEVFGREDVPMFELGKAAHESQYGEYFYIIAVEQQDISLLGLSLPEQMAYREQDLHTLKDVAALVEQPDDLRPYNDLPAVRDGYEDVVQELNGDLRVSEKMQLTAQRAQAKLGKLNPSHPLANREAGWKGKVWLQGSGKADLPNDDPPDSWDVDLPIPQDSLIRVYLNVEMDYINERTLMLSAAVDCGRLHPDDPDDDYDPRKNIISFSTAVDKIPEDESEYADIEGERLETFAEAAFTAIEQVASEINVDKEETSYHFYLHSEGERRSLTDALRRHDDRYACRILRDVLDLRGGIKDSVPHLEQSMVSVVQPALRNHCAFADPGYGIPHAHDQVAGYDKEFWQHTRAADDETVDLRDEFAYQFITRSAPGRRRADGSFEFVSDSEESHDVYYPTRARNRSQLPVEYFWGATDIDVPYEEWKDTEEGFEGLSNRFVWVDSSEEELPIYKGDIEELGERLALALRDIERDLKFCGKILNKDSTVEKHPLPANLPRLEVELGNRESRSLADCGSDVVDLEHEASLRELERRRDKPVLERIRTGRAIPVVVESFESDACDVVAEMAYDHRALDGENRELLEQACRVDGPFVTASKLSADSGELAVDTDEWSVSNAPRFSIENLDWDAGIIHLEGASKMWWRNDEYEQWYPTPRFGEPAENGYECTINEGDLLLLDEDDMTIGAARANHALNGADGNQLYDLIESIRTGSYTPADLVTSGFDTAGVEDFLNDLEEAAEASDNDEFVAPNKKQREFIEKTDVNLSLLQGPPGTGKTKGSLAPGLLSRASSRLANEEPFNGLIAAPTHTAIDEVLDETVHLHEWCLNEDVGDVEGVQLVRLDKNPSDGGNDDVRYLDTSNSSDMSWLVRALWTAKLDDVRSVIVFATPQSVFKLTKQLYDGNEAPSAAYSTSPQLFSLLAVDEASMMTLPQLFMASPLITEDAQTVIAGDHRQMPPVQQRGWIDEDRTPTIQSAAFLSALNFCRYLRGDDVERLKRHDLFDEDSPEADGIEFTRLRKTYRCHLDVTEFLRRWMYEQDGIKYVSDVDSTLETADGDVPDALHPVFEESPLILITHDDRGSQQRNETEANLVSRLCELVPGEEGVGVVTPHNAQKALIGARTGDNVDVDTVERFQGDERECIVVSAAVSDPSYLDLESDFIMNPNRLNVALSRMKKKLVVVAPESLFELVPQEKDAYQDAQIWKGLHATATKGGPATTGEGETTGTIFRVYTFDGYEEVSSDN
ncbi:DEAD/DEAH box helicase [Haloterrigena alkaliphila]|uniref:AAA family ATPase n=1 Tax=Haloterrigena alkaliphila TaxID=2816475 RepID=A0A8A2V718_9EURY|nr:AAA domain-containing protein [Haloterrigena alkaliphila]QSW97659.1 AAA domain-containing protein [Haloterrigena alkaliphila]